MTAERASHTKHRHLIAGGDSLPHLSFPLLAAPGSVAWSQGRTASVIFVPHHHACPDCDTYARHLSAAVEELAEWASRLLLLVPPGAEAAWTALGHVPGLLLLADLDGTGRTRLGVREDQAAVVQADRWGAVYEAAAVPFGALHEANLPTPEALVSLAKFIDIQCPECGVPSKEWLVASPFPLG